VAYLALLAVTAFAFPQPIALLLSGAIRVLTGLGWTLTSSVVVWSGVALLGFFALAGLAWLVSGITAVHRQDRARRRAAELREQAQQWDAQFQIRREELPAGPVREQADRLVAALAAFEDTRAYRDGWAGQGWAHTLHVRRWSLLNRLHDSLAVRADLAEAARLTHRTPDLDRIVTERTADIDALDAELAAEIDQLNQLAAQARDLDAALETADAARAERERADCLARRLGAAASTAEELDAEHRRIRDLLLIEAPEGDLSILTASLRALTRHIAHQDQ
jgi:hypothetical protein